MVASMLNSKPLANTGYEPIFSKHGRVKRNNPCPICQHTNWCTISDNGYFVICMRPSKAGSALGWLYVKDSDNGGKLYKSSDLTSEQLSPPPAINPAIHFEGDKSTGHASVERAEPAILHQVYSDLMKALPLHNRHLKILLDPKGKRRFTMADIAAMGLKSMPDSQDELNRTLGQLAGRHGVEALLKIPGFYLDKKNNLSLATGAIKGMLIPSYNGHQVTGLRVYPDKPGNGPKYYWLSSAGTGKQGPAAQAKASIYKPLQASANNGRPGGIVGITEGEFKAHIAAQYLSYPVISTPGIQSWKTAGVVEAAVELAGQGGRVVVYYDMEANKATDRARLALAESLSGAGLKVELAEWTTTCKGIDDLLMAGGTFTTSHYFHGLAGIKIDQVTSDRFSSDISLSKKITLIKSPKGSGKTESIARFISGLPGNASVMSIGHRVALLGEQSRRWSLEFYQDFKGVKIDRKGLTESNRLAICLDSLIHLNTATGRTYIILDEVEQVLRHLTGSTIRENRRGVLAMFEALIQRAEHVIALDADLGGITYHYFERLVGAANIEVLVNEFNHEKAIPMVQYNHQSQITFALLEKLKAGVKCYVPTNNKREAQKLERIIEKEFPELKVLCVHQDNSANPAIRQVIANLNLYATNYDVLIASPTLGTGIDINVKHFTETFLLGTHNSTNHSDLLQHMARNRQPDLIHAWVAPGERSEPTEPAYWEQACIDNYRQTGQFIKYDLETGKRVANPFDISYLKLWSSIQAAEKASHNRLAANFYEQAGREGYQVRPVAEPAINIFDALDVVESDLAETGKKRAAAGQELKEEHEERILRAKDISDKEAAELGAKAYLPKTEKAKLEKWQLHNFYNLPVDANLIKIDKSGRVRPRLTAYMMYAGLISTIEADQKNFEDAENLIPDSRHYTASKNLRVEALATAGIGLDNSFTAMDLKNNGFIEWSRANKDRIYNLLGIVVKSDFEQRPVELLSSIFQQLNIKLESHFVGKRAEKTRVYSIDLESVKLMARLAKARLEKLNPKELESRQIA
jgi:hypothetical protein